MEKKLWSVRTPKTIRRVRTNVALTPLLFQKVKDYNLKLSAFLQIKLAEYFAYIEGNQPYMQTQQPYTPKTHTVLTTNEKTRLKNQELYREVGLSEFESESLAPKAKRMDQATPQAPTYTV